MSAIISGALLMVLGSIDGSQSTEPPANPLWNAWADCIRTTAIRLSSSSDAADLVARAVVTSCEPRLERFLTSDQGDMSDPRRASEIMLITNALRTGYVARARDEALVIILEARSNRR